MISETATPNVVQLIVDGTLGVVLEIALRLVVEDLKADLEQLQ